MLHHGAHALLVLASRGLGAQPGGTPLDTARIGAALRAEAAATHAPGASIAVVVGDRIAYTNAIGVRDAETGAPMTPETLVRIGSVTKLFTGLLAVLLAQEDRFDLHAPIARVVPGLAPAIGERTMHALLTHTAGMVDEGAANGSHDDDALARRVRTWGADRLFAPSGDVFSYASPGYWLAGHVLERAAGAPYADLLREKVLVPTGMLRSTVRPLVAMTYPLALDHVVREGKATVARPYPDDASTWPSGSLFSSVTELARLAIALMHDGVVDGKEVIPGAAVRALLGAGAAAPGSACRYAYGLSVCQRGQVETAGHYGFRTGSGAVFTLVPAERVAVIVLSNRNGGIFGATEQAALAALLGELATEEGAADGVTRAAPPDRATAGRRLVGTWVRGRDTLRVRAAGDSLALRYGDAEQPARVGNDGTLVVLDGAGEPAQQFRVVRGARSGDDYLHDGLGAFRRARTAPRSPSLERTPRRR